MDFFQQTMRILSGLIMVYYLLLIMSFVLSWIPSSSASPFRTFVKNFTDPYMKHFRNISWLRFGMLDFSPVSGLMILGFVLFVTQNLAAGIFPEWYHLLFWVIMQIWGFIAFLILILIIMTLVRLISLYVVKGANPPWTAHTDRILFPVISRFFGVFTSKPLRYPVALAVFAAVLIAVRTLAGWGLVTLIDYLTNVLSQSAAYVPG